MAAASKAIDPLPETHKYTQEEQAFLEGFRHEALKLARNVEAVFDDPLFR